MQANCPPTSALPTSQPPVSQPPEDVERTPEERVGEKRLLVYLLESGLVTDGQLQVLQYDREMTGRCFSEILIDRGWVRKQTLDFLIDRVIIPEQRAKRNHSNYAPNRRMEPISALGKAYLEQQQQVKKEDVAWTVD